MITCNQHEWQDEPCDLTGTWVEYCSKCGLIRQTTADQDGTSVTYIDPLYDEEDDVEYEEELDGCECDNTHEANNTVCRWCWARGRRHWNDPDVNPFTAFQDISGPTPDIERHA